MIIVCFASEPWHGLWQRHQHLMSRLAGRGHIIFYVDPTNVMNAVKFSQLFRDRIIRLDNGVTVVRPLFLPLHHKIRSLERYDAKATTVLLKEALGRVGLPDPDVLWLSSPFFGFAANGFQSSAIIYDCVDACAGFSSDPATMRWFEDKEKELVTRADTVLSVSRPLLNKCAMVNRDCHLVPNGTPVISSGNDIPSDLASLPRPRIGFIGRLGFWVDYGSLLELAMERPDCSIVLIGPVDVENGQLSKLRRMANVHFLGTKRYEDIPGYIEGLDVCTIPFTVQDLTAMANPVKLFEYASLGKPIVATPLDGIMEYRDVAYITDGSSHDFVLQVDAALKEDDEEIKNRRIELARKHNWDSIALDVEGLLSKAVQCKADRLSGTGQNIPSTAQARTV